MKKVTELCIQWIQEYFADNPEGKAIIGISGGKDSTIAAALCAKALGPERVIGVLMPNGEQSDIDDAFEVSKILDIEPIVVNIGHAYCSLAKYLQIEYGIEQLPSIITTNTPARLRMVVLYMVGGMYPNSRVVNTCNRSEDYVGYSTKYGDAAGDFSPLGMLTVREVLEIGDDLGLPRHLVHKAPSDGMCGRTDEDNLGFTYEELDAFLLEGQVPADPEKAKRIMTLHLQSRHKYRPMPTFCWQDYDKDWTNV
jgi:NAD+ synthase